MVNDREELLPHRLLQRSWAPTALPTPIPGTNSRGTHGLWAAGECSVWGLRQWELARLLWPRCLIRLLLIQAMCVCKREGSPAYPGSGVRGASWGSQPQGGPWALGVHLQRPQPGLGRSGHLEASRGGLLGVLADAAVSAPRPGAIPTGGVTLAQPVQGCSPWPGSVTRQGPLPPALLGCSLLLGEDHVLAAGMRVSVSVCNVSGCECVTVCVCVGSMPVQL